MSSGLTALSAGPLLGTLQGTLTPEGILQMMEAMRQQQAEELQRRAATLGTQAQEAQGAFQQAAAAPAPQLAPADVFVPTLLSGLAAAITGSQAPRERAEQRIRDDRAALLQARSQNLQALRDVYSQRAEEAQRAGDLETTEKYRRQYEGLAKQLELVEANARRVQQQQLEEMREEGREKRQGKALESLEKRATDRAAGSPTKDLPPKSIYLGTERMSIGLLRNRATTPEDARNEIIALKNAAFQRYKDEHTPEAMRMRLVRLRHVLATVRLKAQTWQMLGFGPKERDPSTLLSDPEIDQAVADSFSDEELESLARSRRK